MNRRGFFKLFGGAIAASMLPLGVLALRRFAPLDKRNVGIVDVRFDYSLADFENRIPHPAVVKLAQQLDTEMMRGLI